MNTANFTYNDQNNQNLLAIMDAVKSKWKTAENFYRERDNRTALQIENLDCYAVKPIEIWVDPLLKNSTAVQEIALLMCNLTARWARRITVRFPTETVLAKSLQRNGFCRLADRILYEMKTADPFGDFSVSDYVAPIGKNERSSLRIFIGAWLNTSVISPAINDNDYFIDTSGWSVFGKRGGGFNKYINQETSVAVTGLAAALGVADLFKRAVGHDREEWLPEDFLWNVWEQRFSNSNLTVSEMRTQKNERYPVLRYLDLGRTLLAGVGAIGSALVYLMDFMELSGEIALLDRDRAEMSNLNRSPLFNVLHAVEGWEKTRIAVDYLNRHQIKISTKNGVWQEHAAQIAREPFDQWISLTNEDGAWATVPYLLPPVVLHGTTTSGWGFGSGRHLPLLEDCTLCRMPRPEIKFRALCAQGEIPNINADGQTSVATASLPFLSAASAALLLAEIIKLSVTLTHSHFADSISEGYNETAVDLRFGLHGIMPLKRVPNGTCRGCRAGNSNKWLEFGGRSRYRFLSKRKFKAYSELKAA